MREQKEVHVAPSKRFRFRLMDSRDAQRWFELDQDPEVMRFLNEGRPSTWQETEEFVIPRVASFTDRLEGTGLWEVADRETGEYLGWILARHYRHGFPDVERDNIELGWRLKRHCWGRGVATEAARSVLQALATSKNIRVFSAMADPANLASIGVMKNLGMQHIDARVHVVIGRGDYPVDYYERPARDDAHPDAG